MSSRRRARASSTSIARQTPSFIVTASGWAPPIPPRPAVSTTRPRERPAEVLPRQLRERLVRALEDALRPDVDPRAGGHLAVHRQALALELAEDVPGRPVADEVRVRDQHPRRPLVGPEHARPACRSGRAASRRRRGGAARGRSRRTPPSSGPPDRSRRRRRARRGSRRPPGRGCSSASGGPPPGPSRGSSAPGHAGHGRGGRRRPAGDRRSSLEDTRRRAPPVSRAGELHELLAEPAVADGGQRDDDVRGPRGGRDT